MIKRLTAVVSVALVGLLCPAVSVAATNCGIVASSSNIDPGLASLPNGPVDIFYVSTNENLLRLQIGPPRWSTTWSGWIGLDAPYAAASPNNPEATANAYGGWTMAAINFPSGARVGQLRACSQTQ